MSSILQKQIGIGKGNILVTNTETLAAYTGRCEVTAPTVRSIIKCWVWFQTGAAATGIVFRIRRGNGIAGPIVGADTPTILYPAGTVAQFTFIIAESLQDSEFVDYSLTLTQLGAAGNGTLSLSSIEVEVING
jgi:hypothetical protein